MKMLAAGDRWIVEKEKEEKFAMDSSLVPPLGMGFLNLHWILQGADAMLAAHSEIERLLLESPPPKRERDFLASVFLDSNTAQLEIVNGVKKGLLLAGQKRMRIKYALNLAKNSATSGEELELRRAKAFVEEVVGEIERCSEVKITHTGSRLLELHSQKSSATKKTKKVTKIGSKVIETNLVSGLVLAVVIAGLDCRSPVLPIDTAARNFPALAGLTSLWEDLKEEAEARSRNHGESGGGSSSPLLDGIFSSLKEVSSALDSWISKTKRIKDENEKNEEELRIKQLLNLAHKKMEYLDSSFQILEEEFTDLFSKLIANRRKVLSIAP